MSAAVADLRPCDWCGTDFMPSRAPQIYCGHGCAAKACWSRWHHGETAVRTIPCAECGAEFTTSRRNGRFCQRRCAVAYHARHDPRRARVA